MSEDIQDNVDVPVLEQDSSTWYDSFDDEMKGYIQNKKWDDPQKAVKSYMELEKFRGAPEDRLLVLPKDPNEEGAFNKIYEKLGRPESPDKYEIDLPKELNIDEARLNIAKDVAHKLGLNNNQLNAFIKADMEYSKGFTQNIEAELEKQQTLEIQQLKKDWGQAFDERAELGRRFIRENIPDNVDKDAMLQTIERAIGSNLTLRLFGNAAEKAYSKEDRVPSASGDRPYAYTKEQAAADRRALIDELSGDKTRLSNYNKGIGPDVEKMNRLLKLMG